MPVTPSDLNRFSKFFHWLIEQKGLLNCSFSEGFFIGFLGFSFKVLMMFPLSAMWLFDAPIR